MDFFGRTRDLFLGGVYNDTYEVRTDGGPKCSQESTLGLKYLLSMIQIPVHIIILYYGTAYLARNFQDKKNYLIKTGRGLNPSILEVLQGILCFTLLGL